MFRKHRLGAGLMAACICAVSAQQFAVSAPAESASAASDFNYAEALQKSLFFYECQQAGNLPEWNRVEWRGNSLTMDEIDGGWYDAGDHVKFNLPMAYSASMLAWGLYQYPDGVESCGEMTNYVNNLAYVMDYFAACDKGSSIVYQIGSGTVDHTWWGPVELYEYAMAESGTNIKNARVTLESSKGCSAVFGEMAAALASGAVALKGRVDSSKTDSYLKHAVSIYKVAKTSPNDDVYNDSDASGFYRSSHFYDQLFYAANWLYMATGDDSYLAEAKSYIPNLSKQLGEGDTLAYGWTHCWDDNMQGAMLLYAINSKDDTYIAHVKKHLNVWLKGAGEPVILEGGLRWLTNWGCLRYANTAAFLAAVASDTIFKGEDVSDLMEFAETQINYTLGDNPRKSSYVCGFGNNPPKNPHHRTSHASWNNAEAKPTTSRHTLYGALVGGPEQNGSYVDDRGNYINNEVATDYNAGFTAMLCKMVSKYGGKSDPSFPPKEAHDGPELFVVAEGKTSSSSGITVSLKLTNHTAWPARVVDNVSFRYYMDLSEVKAAGKDPASVTIRCDRDQSKMYADDGVKPAVITGPIQYSGDIYYVDVTLPDGRACLPISEGRHQCEILLALVFPDYGNGWDATNDFSNKDILSGKDAVMTPYVPVYVDGKLYYGEEPDGTSADGMGSTGESGNTQPITTTTQKPVETTKPTTTTKTVTTTTLAPVTTEGNPGGDAATLHGDVDCNGKVMIADAVLLSRYVNEEAVTITKTGLANAECDGESGLTTNDVSAILKHIARLIDLNA